MLYSATKFCYCRLTMPVKSNTSVGITDDVNFLWFKQKVACEETGIIRGPVSLSSLLPPSPGVP